MNIFKFFPIALISINIFSGVAQNSPPKELPPLHERAMQTNPLFVQTGKPHVSPDVTISIDYANPLLTSNLTFGITHTHYKWQKGNSDAVAKAKELLKSVGYFHNTHIINWGAGNIKTDINGIPGNLDVGLTPAVNKVTELGEGVITFCTAPGWMQDGGSGNPDAPLSSNNDKAVAPQYEDAFATLCAEIAKKYTQVKYFQVWNEFKGLGVRGSPGVWDYERYTRFYNKIYRKVKEVRPDALIGGFYQVIAGDGTADILGSTGRYTNMPIDASTKGGMEYFLKHADGVDFFCVDRNIISYHNPNRGTYTDVQSMKLTPVWGIFMNEVVKALNNKNIPIMYSEYYATVSGYKPKQGDPGVVTGGADFHQFAAAQYASVYNHILRNSAGQETWMLLWMEDEKDIPANAIFTNTDKASGGKPHPLYWVKKAYKDWFNHTTLVSTTSSSEDVEVIAGVEATLVINKRNTPVKVNINGKGIALSAFSVALLDLSAAH